LLLLGLIVIISGGSVLVGIALRKRFPRITQDEHNDALRFGYGVIGFVYAFFIGFVVSAMWGQVNDADTLVRTEGAAGVQLARDASVFDSSYERGAPVEFPLTGVVPGFQKAIAGQKVGSTVAVAMVSADGYPDGQPRAGILPGDSLIFAIKILGVTG
jgi:hypothetical protein